MLSQDPLTPASVERASSLRLRVEEPIGVPAPSEPTGSAPEEAKQPEEFTPLPRRRPMHPWVYPLVGG